MFLDSLASSSVVLYHRTALLRNLFGTSRLLSMGVIIISVVFRQFNDDDRWYEFVVVGSRDAYRRINYRVMNRTFTGENRHRFAWGSGDSSGDNVSSFSFHNINRLGFTVGRFSGRNKGNERLVRGVIEACAARKGIDEWPGATGDASGEDDTEDEDEMKRLVGKHPGPKSSGPGPSRRPGRDDDGSGRAGSFSASGVSAATRRSPVV